MDRLLSLLHEHSYREGRVRLASGAESDFFIDCKQTALLAEGHALVGAAMASALEDLPGPLDAVAGVALGGCSLASAVSMHTHLEAGRAGLNAVYVRKAAKDHGSKKLVEGADRLPKGARLAVLEDVATTGGSTIKAVALLRELGFVVAGVVAIVDRLEGAAANFERAGLPFISLYTRNDFVSS